MWSWRLNANSPDKKRLLKIFSAYCFDMDTIYGNHVKKIRVERGSVRRSTWLRLYILRCFVNKLQYGVLALSPGKSAKLSLLSKRIWSLQFLRYGGVNISIFLLWIRKRGEQAGDLTFFVVKSPNNAFLPGHNNVSFYLMLSIYLVVLTF